MGRRSSKGGRGVVARDYDTVGVTILPGHPLPEWAEPSGEPAVAASDAVESQVPAEPALAASPASSPESPATEPTWGAAPTMLGGEAPHVGQAPSPAAAPAYAMATSPASAQIPSAYAMHESDTAGNVPSYAMAGPAAQLSAPGAQNPYGGVPTAATGSFAPATHPSTSGLGDIAATPPAPGPSSFPTPSQPTDAIPSGPSPVAGSPVATNPIGATAASPMTAQAGYAPAGALGGYAGASGPIPPRWSDAPPPPSGQSAATATLPPARQTEATQDGPAPIADASAPTSAPSPSTDGSVHASDAADMPSTGWNASDRPELSPEHVALLTWWADMIAKGQYPAPPGTPESAPPTPAKRGLLRRKPASSTTVAPEAAVVASAAIATAAASNAPTALDPFSAAPSTQAPAAVVAPSAAASEAFGQEPTLDAPPNRPQEGRHSRRGPILVGLGLGAVALTGLVIAFGPGLYDSVMADEPPAPVAPTTLTMPTAVGDLVVLTGEGVDEQLVPLVGLGIRPTGVTATGAYATAADAPLALAALATSLPAPASEAEQITAWANRTGATVGEPVGGEGGVAGITCADATELTSGPDGAVCVWTGTRDRGQTFVVATSAKSALETTAAFRSALESGAAPTS